jgi:hypothetical protein
VYRDIQAEAYILPYTYFLKEIEAEGQLNAYHSPGCSPPAPYPAVLVSCLPAEVIPVFKQATFIYLVFTSATLLFASLLYTHVEKENNMWYCFVFVIKKFIKLEAGVISATHEEGGSLRKVDHCLRPALGKKLLRPYLKSKLKAKSCMVQMIEPVQSPEFKP